MNVTFKHKGDAIDFAPAADVTAGDVLVNGDLVGIAKLDIKAGVLGSLHVCGVFDFPKPSGAGTAIPLGTKAYWDNTAKVATADDASGANKYLGKVIRAASDEDAMVCIRLNQ